MIPFWIAGAFFTFGIMEHKVFENQNLSGTVILIICVAASWPFILGSELRKLLKP